jgi:hypothetical protein
VPILSAQVLATGGETKVITLDDAFRKFKSRLELTDKEQADASRRQNNIRDLLRDHFDIDRDFLTGSYARWTKTKPLKDVDIFCVLGDGESHYHNEHPTAVLKAFKETLAGQYGDSKVGLQRRSVQVDFQVRVVDDDAGGQVMSFDVVPAFAVGKHYEIPDTSTSGWIKTDPEIHKEEGVKANEAFSKEWKPLVKMIKKWNQVAEKPVKPSFLLEVMALQILVPPYSNYQHELKTFFATAADRISETWNDPAGLGPPVSDQMDATKVEEAKRAFRKVEESVTRALRYGREGRNGEALQEWRKLFGPLFPLS